VLAHIVNSIAQLISLGGVQAAAPSRVSSRDGRKAEPSHFPIEAIAFSDLMAAAAADHLFR